MSLGPVQCSAGCTGARRWPFSPCPFVPRETGCPRPSSHGRCRVGHPAPAQPMVPQCRGLAASPYMVLILPLGKLLLSWAHLRGRSQSGHISRVFSRTFFELPSALRPEGMSDFQTGTPQDKMCRTGQKKAGRQQQRAVVRPLLRATAPLRPAPIN